VTTLRADVPAVRTILHRHEHGLRSRPLHGGASGHDRTSSDGGRRGRGSRRSYRRGSWNRRNQNVRDLGRNRGRPDAMRQGTSGTSGDVHGRRARRGAGDARARGRRARARRKRRQGERRRLRRRGRNHGHLKTRRPERLRLPKRHPRVESSYHVLQVGDEGRGEAQPLRRGERQEGSLRGVPNGVQFGVGGNVLPEGGGRGTKLALPDEVSENPNKKKPLRTRPVPYASAQSRASSFPDTSCRVSRSLVTVMRAWLKSIRRRKGD
jgi:hypothetical protein